MTIPSSFNNNVTNIHYYQGVILAEVGTTLILFLILKGIHYVKWGHDQQVPSQKSEQKPAEQSSQQTCKWDQKSWNVYFPIIFAYHVGALALIILYIPYIYAAVISFLHFAFFIVLLILNICIKDAEPGQGNRTKGSRVVWAFMSVLNIMLIIGGLTGVPLVYS